MTPSQLENLENIRRTAENIKEAGEAAYSPALVDYALHLLNLVELIEAEEGCIC